MYSLWLGRCAQSGVIPGFIPETDDAQGAPLRTSPDYQLWEKERPTGAGTCLSDINDRMVHCCADSTLFLFPLITPGWE